MNASLSIPTTKQNHLTNLGIIIAGGLAIAYLLTWVNSIEDTITRGTLLTAPVACVSLLLLGLPIYRSRKTQRDWQHALKQRDIGIVYFFFYTNGITIRRLQEAYEQIGEIGQESYRILILELLEKKYQLNISWDQIPELE